MALTAFLVSFSPQTRIVIDVDDPENLTDQEFSLAVRTARQKMLDSIIEDYLCGDNAEVNPDTEIPYGELTEDNEE